MDFLADENFPMHVVTALRGLGYDVVSVRTDYPGIDDYQVVELARTMGRVLLTFDKGFSDLAFERRLPIESGIVLFRIRISDPDSIRDAILTVVESRQTGQDIYQSWKKDESESDDCPNRIEPRVK